MLMQLSLICRLKMKEGQTSLRGVGSGGFPAPERGTAIVEDAISLSLAAVTATEDLKYSSKSMLSSHKHKG